MTKEEQSEIFNEWLNRYKALLFKVVRVYAADQDDQDDLFQEISIQVWKSVISFEKRSAVSTWLYRISLNTAFAWKRKTKKHHEGRNELEKTEHLLYHNPDQNDDRLEWLYDEISKLSNIDRSLCLMMLDGFSYKEMSGVIGITESNVGVKINRIKKNLIVKSEKLK